MRTGRPRKLTAEQELSVYQRITATRMRRRCFAYSELARTLGVGVSTLERIVTRLRRQQFAVVADRFHANLKSQNPLNPENPYESL